MYTIVPGLLLFILGQCSGHLPLGDIKDLENQIKDHDATAKGINLSDSFNMHGKKSSPQLCSSLCGISDVTFVEGTCAIGCIAECLLELKLVNGSCKVSEMKM